MIEDPVGVNPWVQIDNALYKRIMVLAEKEMQTNGLRAPLIYLRQQKWSNTTSDHKFEYKGK